MFLLLLFAVPVFEAVQASCLMPEGGEQVQVGRVIDGDTVVLHDGRRIRLIGVNAPERTGKFQPGEPFAERARDFVQVFVKGVGHLVLHPGEEVKDRFGRTLAHLFSPEGESLEEQLLARGLARHLVIGRNDRFKDCLAQAEARARRDSKGLWALPYYKVRDVDTDDQGLESGFQLLQGEVASVSTPTGQAWWLDLVGNVSVRIRVVDQGRFDRAVLQRLEGRRVEIRGWLIERGRNEGKKSQWLLPVSHPAGVQVLPKKCTGCER